MSNKATHSPILSLEEGLQLYEAAAFLMWWFGLSFTVHLTISWGAMGIVDGEAVMKALSLFNAEAGKWLRVGFERETVQRHGSRFGYGRNHCYIGVHECGGRFGLHSHLLVTVPLPVANKFVDWSKGRFRDYSGRPWIPESAVYGAISNARNEAESVQRHWGWMRYSWKQIETDREILANDGSWLPDRGDHEALAAAIAPNSTDEARHSDLPKLGTQCAEGRRLRVSVYARRF